MSRRRSFVIFMVLEVAEIESKDPILIMFLFVIILKPRSSFKAFFKAFLSVFKAIFKAKHTYFLVSTFKSAVLSQLQLLHVHLWLLNFSFVFYCAFWTFFSEFSSFELHVFTKFRTLTICYRNNIIFTLIKKMKLRTFTTHIRKK